MYKARGAKIVQSTAGETKELMVPLDQKHRFWGAMITSKGVAGGATVYDGAGIEVMCVECNANRSNNVMFPIGVPMVGLQVTTDADICLHVLVSDFYGTGVPDDVE